MAKGDINRESVRGQRADIRRTNYETLATDKDVYEFTKEAVEMYEIGSILDYRRPLLSDKQREELRDVKNNNELFQKRMREIVREEFKQDAQKLVGMLENPYVAESLLKFFEAGEKILGLRKEFDKLVSKLQSQEDVFGVPFFTDHQNKMESTLSEMGLELNKTYNAERVIN